jgi:hypothetical protein
MQVARFFHENLARAENIDVSHTKKLTPKRVWQVWRRLMGMKS